MEKKCLLYEVTVSGYVQMMPLLLSLPLPSCSLGSSFAVRGTQVESATPMPVAVEEVLGRSRENHSHMLLVGNVLRPLDDKLKVGGLGSLFGEQGEKTEFKARLGGALRGLMGNPGNPACGSGVGPGGL